MPQSISDFMIHIDGVSDVLVDATEKLTGNAEFWEIASKYLGALRETKEYLLLADPNPQLEPADAHTIITTATSIQTLHGEGNWQSVLQQTHAFLSALPGDPPSRPEIPPPPIGTHARSRF